MKQCGLEGTLAALLNVRFTGVITLVGVFGGSPMSKIEYSYLSNTLSTTTEYRNVPKYYTSIDIYELSYHKAAGLFD